MNPLDAGDGAWLRDRLTGAVPEPPTSTDRMARLYTGRQRARRRLATGAALAVFVTVGGLSVAASTVFGHSPDRSAPPVDVAPTTTAPALTTPALECPRTRATQSDSGPSTLAAGATAALLCGAGPFQSAAPTDLLTEGLDGLVDSVNAQPPYTSWDCSGRMGDRYLLLLAYPDGTERRVSLDFSGCGTIGIGGATRANPGTPYETFMDLLHAQRLTETAPAHAPVPACLPPHSSSAIAEPGEMVAARLCVTYNDNGKTTSVAVPDADLATILDAWSNGPQTPLEKGPGCSPTTPTWVLSGVTRWGDPVAITAECNHPTMGDAVVVLTPQAQQVTDRLVTQAGVHVDDGANAPTAWMLANAWLGAVNARATVSYGQTAADIARIADNMWVNDPWLPDRELDWDLLGASRTEATGWQQAWQIPARTPQGPAVFVVVRHGTDDPWRILTLDR